MHILTPNKENTKARAEIAPSPSIDPFPRTKRSTRREVSFQALHNDGRDDPTKQPHAASRALCSERAEGDLPMQQLCKCVRLLSS